MWKIQLCELNYDEREEKAVQAILKSAWLTMGEVTKNFETEFANYHGRKHECIAVSSATAGLHLGLMALGIGIGDEVIIPALTFVSDANTVCQLGATPVFADICGLNDLNVDVNDILLKINEKTKAIVAVHFAGYPIDLTKLRDICDEKGIYLIEDVAHAPGAMINEKRCGTMGHLSFFSFFSNKNLATGEGGMVMTSDSGLANKIRSLRSHGMTSLTLDRHNGRSSSYDVVDVGLNYRIDEIRSSIGLQQLAKLDEGNKIRGELVNAYYEHLVDTSIILPNYMQENDTVVPAYHIMPVILPEKLDRSVIIDRLKTVGIQTSIHYPNFGSFKAYRSIYDPRVTRNTNEVTERELTLPLHPKLSKYDIEFVCDNLKESMLNV